MKNNKVTKFPISRADFIKNSGGLGYAPCLVSDRWLQFNTEFEPGPNFISVNVMTGEKGKSEHKICHLFLELDDIEKALDIIKKNSEL